MPKTETEMETHYSPRSHTMQRSSSVQLAVALAG